jgi:hypothetical protein
MATGAVLGREIEQVVARTADAVELVRLPVASGAQGGVPLQRALVLAGEPDAIAEVLSDHGDTDTFLADGAVGEHFLDALLAARRGREPRTLRIVAEDPTKVFLSQRSAGWYRLQGISIEVKHPMVLRAITVNPVAPQSHSFDSAVLRAAIADAVADVPVLDVREDA